MVLHHRDDSRICDFYMLLHLYGFSFLAQRTGRQDWSEEPEGSWKSADNRQSSDLGFYLRPRRGPHLQSHVQAILLLPISSRERF